MIPTVSDLIFKWYWRYHVLGVEEFDSVESAALSADWDVEEGRAALDHIEVIRDDGTTERIDPDKASEIATAYHAKQTAKAPPPRKLTRKLVVKSPAGVEVALEWYSDEAEADRDYRRLAERLGNRVRLDPA